MIPLHNFVRIMENYAVFEGRASRPEFWWFVLATLIIALPLGLVSIPLSFIPHATDIIIYAFGQVPACGVGDCQSFCSNQAAIG